jgi:parvulin-like peptidyl-prolyl isomerase
MTNGRSGFFGHGDMQKEFEEAAFALNKGEVSDVVDTASGLHLIQRSVPSVQDSDATLTYCTTG